MSRRIGTSLTSLPIVPFVLATLFVLGASQTAAPQDVFVPARPPSPVDARGGLTPASRDAAPRDRSGARRPGPPLQTFSIMSVEPFETAQPVLRAPYTAEAVTEVTQDLADGNRIVNRTSATIARDSRGRVRREHQAVFVGPIVADRVAPLVTITDPAAGRHLTLDEERRVAFLVRTPQSVGGTFEFAAPVTAGVPVPFTATLTAAPSFTIAAEPPLPGGQIGIAAAPPVTTRLGDRLIEGVRATGTRTVTTIPAGQIGNQLPIDVVNERWYSPDLQVVIASRRADPRFGETLYRLINIVRAEPPADLFEVPPGFLVESPDDPRR
jgi:hypothetical protein